MSLEIVRRIRGNVHGSIDITELEDKGINTLLLPKTSTNQATSFSSLCFSRSDSY